MNENDKKIVELNAFKKGKEKEKSYLKNIQSDVLGKIVNVQFENEEELYYITALVYDNRNGELSALSENDEEIMKAAYIIKFIEFFQLDKENEEYIEKKIELTPEDYQKIYESIVQSLQKYDDEN